MPSRVTPVGACAMRWESTPLIGGALVVCVLVCNNKSKDGAREPSMKWPQRVAPSLNTCARVKPIVSVTRVGV